MMIEEAMCSVLDASLPLIHINTKVYTFVSAILVYFIIFNLKIMINYWWIVMFGKDKYTILRSYKITGFFYYKIIK